MSVKLAWLIAIAGALAALVTVRIRSWTHLPRTAADLPAYHQLTVADVEGPAGEMSRRYRLQPLAFSDPIVVLSPHLRG